MGSSFLSIALCLASAFLMVSCGSLTRSVAQEVKRAPEFRNKETNRQFVREKY